MSTPHRNPAAEDGANAYLIVALVTVVVQAIQLKLLAHDLSVTGPIIDGGEFHAMAARLAAGVPLPHQTFFQSPIYPWLLSLDYRLFGSQPAHALLLQAALSIVIACEVLALARAWLSPRAALITGLAAALYGPLLFFAGQVTSAPLDAATALAALLVATRTNGQSTPLKHLGLGLLSGVAIAVRGTVAPFVLFLAFRPLWENRRRIVSGAGRVLSLSLGVFLGLLPVGWENWRQSGQFALLTSNAGVNLWIGNNPDVAATTALRPGHAWDALLSEPARHGARTALASSAYFEHQTLAWITHHPLAALDAFLMKWGDLLNGIEVPRNLDPYGPLAHTPLTHALLWTVPLLRFPFGLVLPLAALGIAWRWRDPPARTILAFAVLNAAGICLFFPSGRYRLAIDLALLPPAIDGGRLLWERLRGQREGVGWAAAGAVIALALWANLAPQLTGPHLAAELPMQRVLTHQSAGRWTDAVSELAVIVSQHPDDADAWRTLGYVRGRLGDESGAADALEHAVKLVPDYANALQHLGEIRLLERRPQAAIPLLEAAVKSNPLHEFAWDELAEAYFDVQDLPNAIRAGKEAVRVNPDQPRGWLFLGAALRQTDDLPGAEAALRKAIALQPTLASAHYQLALALNSQGRRDDAIHEAQEALRIVPEHRGARALMEQLAQAQ